MQGRKKGRREREKRKDERRNSRVRSYKTSHCLTRLPLSVEINPTLFLSRRSLSMSVHDVRHFPRVYRTTDGNFEILFLLLLLLFLRKYTRDLEVSILAISIDFLITLFG